MNVEICFKKYESVDYSDKDKEVQLYCDVFLEGIIDKHSTITFFAREDTIIIMLPNSSEFMKVFRHKVFAARNLLHAPRMKNRGRQDKG